MFEETFAGNDQSPPRTFGPVPSGRFGQSLGVNTIPSKTCSYSCVYCQLGRTDRLTVRREPHGSPGELLTDVRLVVEKLRDRNERLDFITFVSEGEPTLDSRLGDYLRLLRSLGIPLAVITNASLLSRDDVRQDVMNADRVSVKIDTVRHNTWRRIDRPHGDLSLVEVLNGVLQFSREFKGELDTETMLVEGLNDSADDLSPIAAFLEQVKPLRAYLAVPTRPPAVEGVRSPPEDALVRAFEILNSTVTRVELLAGFEGDALAASGDARSDLLAITAVHPMRSDQVEALVNRCGETWEVVEWLIRQELLSEVSFRGNRFYIRRFPGR